MKIKQPKILSHLTIIVFIAFLVLPAIIFPIIAPYIDTENTENRSLAAKPDFKLSEVSGYPSKYEEYFNDNIAFKKQFAKLNTYINSKVFNDFTSDIVLSGKNNWLFYKRIGDGDPISCYKGTNLLNEEGLLIYKDKLIETNERLRSYNKELVLFIAPNKEQVYSEYMPNNIKVVSNFSRSDQLSKYLTETTNLKIVYPFDELTLNKQDYQLYYKNDTHWNELGGFIGSQQLIEKLTGNRTYLNDLNITITNEEVIGDLAQMVNLQNILPKDKKITISNYNENISTESIPSENPEFAAFTSTSQIDMSVLILGDSFRSAMIPYINKAFNESFLGNYNYVTSQDISTIDSDIIVVEVVERYVPFIPSICDKILEAYPQKS